TTSLGPGATVSQGVDPGGTALGSPEAVMRRCSINIEQSNAGVQPPSRSVFEKTKPHLDLVDQVGLDLGDIRLRPRGRAICHRIPLGAAGGPGPAAVESAPL